jgi:alkylhydroperoxidase family enzyme
MLRWLLRRRIAAFERAYGYDASYMRAIIKVSPRAALAFARISGFAHYDRGVPRDASFAAGLVAARAEDCGPCTQLGITMAERAGVPPGVLRAILARDEAGMTPEAALGFRFAEAVLAHAPEADDLREEIVRRWGEEAVISLAFVIAGTRVFPTVKYALGHGKACTRVTIAGASVPVLRQAA